MADNSPQQAPWIIDTSDERFEQDVLERSKETLVVVDFWAPWCGPCRMLGPVLEQLARDFAGEFALVKVNVEECQQVAAGFGIQSIPVVLAINNGEPVSGFQGARPEPEIRQWLQELLPSEAEQMAAEAERLRSDDPAAAEEKYQAALQKDPRDTNAMMGLARLLLQQDRLEECQAIADDLDAHGLLESHAEDIAAGLKLKQQARETGDLEQCRTQAEANPDDLQAQLHYAQALAGAGEYEAALKTALPIVQKDKAGVGQPAKETMVHIFQVLGSDSDLASDYRKQLSAALF